MILRILCYAFLAYLLFKLIFDFIIPVVRTTRRVRKGFREMNERMNQYGPGAAREPDLQVQKPREDPGGDYIDFEEVK